MENFHIVYHDNFIKTVDYTPAGDTETRITIPLEELQKHKDYVFITPKPATEEQILRAHSSRHYRDIQDSTVYDAALLAAGAAIKCAELAESRTPNFGLIRPPGHHASRNSAWGFCYFNNIAVSLLHLKALGKIKSATILDFDLHVGDGNIDILEDDEDLEILILNPRDNKDEKYLKEIEEFFGTISKSDIIVASAGFDQYIKCWGGNLSTQAYNRIGAMMKEFAIKKCNGKRYALLEGGYYEPDLGKNIYSFCEGFRN